MTCFFINGNDCYIELNIGLETRYVDPPPRMANGYASDGKNICHLINGILYREINGSRVQVDDAYGIIDRINTSKNEFNKRYK